MGALQPGLPSPVAIPRKYSKIVIDIKDCFFSIPLDPIDCNRFAFSIPIVNHAGPNPRFQWRVLPQGMTNSPTLCQKFVAQSIDPIQVQCSDAYIIHYMDDLLIAAEQETRVQQVAQKIVMMLQCHRFHIAPEKIQTCYPFLFLGFQLEPNLIYTQKIQVKRDKLQCLNDFQKLLGDINWLRPYLKLTKGEIRPLEDVLRRDTDPCSPRSLMPETELALQKLDPYNSTSSSQEGKALDEKLTNLAYQVSIENSVYQRKGPRSSQSPSEEEDQGAPRQHWTKTPLPAPNPSQKWDDVNAKAKMGRRQCKSAYNIIKNKTTPESSPPPTPKSDYCNADKAEENDLKKSLMKMLEEAFEEKMKNVSKEIGENTNKKLEEINKEIEEKKSKNWRK
ncbi:hypothetical protein STEG23_021987 [Scotinomys teguina]